MAEAIAGIRGAVAGLDEAAFAGSWVVLRAVERGLEIISEASRHLPAEMTAAHPEVPWRQIASIGNVLRHEYQRVEPRILWNVVVVHLSALEAAVARIRAGDSEA